MLRTVQRHVLKHNYLSHLLFCISRLVAFFVRWSLLIFLQFVTAAKFQKPENLCLFIAKNKCLFIARNLQLPEIQQVNFAVKILQYPELGSYVEFSEISPKIN